MAVSACQPQHSAGQMTSGCPQSRKTPGSHVLIAPASAGLRSALAQTCRGPGSTPDPPAYQTLPLSQEQGRPCPTH